MSTLKTKSTESKSLRGGPVDVGPIGDSLASGANNSSQVSVRSEPLWERRNDFTDALQCVFVGSGRVMRQDVFGQLLGSWETLPRRRKPFSSRWLVVFATIVRLFQHSPDPLSVLVDLLLGECALLDELIGVKRQNSGLLLNSFVHGGLGKRRLIGLIVSVSSVANNINDDILLELGSPIGSEGADKIDSLDVVTVDVEDGRVDRLGDIRRVRGGSRESRVRSETDLVVYNQVDRSSSSIIEQRVHSHGLVHDSLTGKGSVTVEQDGHGVVGNSLVTFKVLNSSSLSKNDRVLSFQVRRVGDERKGNLLARRGGSNIVGTQMVLDISSSRVVLVGGTGKLVQDGLDGFSDDVTEDVESTTMRHTHDNGFDTSIDRSINKSLHTGYEGFATFETESLLVGVLGSDKLFKEFRPHGSVENHSLLFGGVLPLLGNFDSFSNPITLSSVGDVDILHTDVVTCHERASGGQLTVGLLHLGNDLAQGGLALWHGAGESRKDILDVKLLLEVLLGPSVVVELQLWGGFRVEIGV